MKISFVFAFVLMACGGLLKTDVRDFIPGSYVRVIDTEFAVGVDSVVLAFESDEHVVITKYSRYARITNGVAGVEESHSAKMVGAYDDEKKVVNEFKKGKVLRFNPQEGKMWIGGSEYAKVK